MPKKPKTTRRKKVSVDSTKDLKRLLVSKKVKKAAKKKIIKKKVAKSFNDAVKFVGSSEYVRPHPGGRPRFFEKPEDLWDKAQEYFEFCRANPWMKNEAVKSGDMAGMIIQVPTARPFTIMGLCLSMGTHSGYWRDFRASAPSQFSAVIKAIEDIIYTQKFEGASVGAFNATIISRDLGLRETSTVELNDNRKVVGDVFPTEDELLGK